MTFSTSTSLFPNKILNIIIYHSLNKLIKYKIISYPSRMKKISQNPFLLSLHTS